MLRKLLVIVALIALGHRLEPEPGQWLASEIGLDDSRTGCKDDTAGPSPAPLPEAFPLPGCGAPLPEEGTTDEDVLKKLEEIRRPWAVPTTEGNR